MTLQRLFFAVPVVAAWPEKVPAGRLIAEEFRHITLAFLGTIDQEALLERVDAIPLPPWKIGPTGLLHQWIFLPERKPRVVAVRPQFLEGEEEFLTYQKQLTQWLFDQHIISSLDASFLPHVTISRAPFEHRAWVHFPCQIPCFISALALYQSLGHSQYKIVWQKEWLAPFQEIEHTADIAFKIRGKDFSQLARHAILALAFSFPVFSRYLSSIPPCHSIYEIVTLLNRWISELDIEEGIGLKAVSYHAHMVENEHFEWTMIVDV